MGRVPPGERVPFPRDKNGVNESFWDGQGVEFEAKQVFDVRACVRVCDCVCVCVFV